jgi:hypothetical protein
LDVRVIFAPTVMTLTDGLIPAAIKLAEDVTVDVTAFAEGVATKTLVIRVNVNSLDSFLTIDLFDL